MKESKNQYVKITDESILVAAIQKIKIKNNDEVMFLRA